MSKQYCFCTLAVGKRYRIHAKMLAADIREHAPGIPFIILTDRPQEFESVPNVLAYLHRLQSVKGYHDKRVVLEKAITRFDSCVFVDADIRILETVPKTLPFSAGIVARYGCSIIKHNSADKVRAGFELIKAGATALNLNLENVYWFHEFMFLFSKQQGKEKAFFDCWRSLSYEFEMNGIYAGEGNVMGLAAAATGLNINFHRSDFFPCFKDSIQKENVRTGKADPKAMADEFKIHRSIEYPERSLVQKVAEKLQVKSGFYHRLAKLKLSQHPAPSLANKMRSLS